MSENSNNDPVGFHVGPSNIRRLSKWRNRHKKAAQHRINHVERANKNRGSLKRGGK